METVSKKIREINQELDRQFKENPLAAYSTRQIREELERRKRMAGASAKGGRIWERLKKRITLFPAE